MLVLPSDSGYNSPCDGIGPSSLYSSLEKFPKPDNSSQVRRKLRIELHTSENSGFHFSLSTSSNRSREIARRLVQICDLFEKEFAETNEIAEDLCYNDAFRISHGQPPYFD